MYKSIYQKLKLIGNSIQSLLLLIIRLYWGYQFFLTGLGKALHLGDIATYFQSLGIPLPYFTAGLISLIELVGGALLFFGLFSRLAALFLLFVMLGAFLIADRAVVITLFTQFDPDPFFNATPFLFAYASIIIFCFGPGKLSLDYHLGRFFQQKEMP